MANTRINDTIRHARQRSYTEALDLGGAGNPGYIDIMSGTQPPNARTAITDQIILGRLYLSYPATLPPESNGRVTFGPVQDDAAPNNEGIARWARFYDGNGLAHLDCDAGVAGTAIVLTTTSITTNPGLISLVSIYIIVPDGS